MRYPILVVAVGASLAACGGSEPSGTQPADAPSATDLAADAGPNAAPVVAIASPHDGQMFAVGEKVAFVATAHDDEDADPELTVTVASSLSGALWTGAPGSAGSVSFETPTLAAGTHAVTVTATDRGGLSGSAAVTITVLAAADAPTVYISPATPTTGDDLVASVAAAPGTPDGVEWRYRWLKDGIDAGVAAATVPASLTARGETWQVRVGVDVGGVVGSEGTAEVTIGNAAPECKTAVLLPSSAGTDADLSCTCAEWSDPDPGDTAHDACAFLLEGVSLGADSGCVLAASATKKGMVVTCALTPSDGTHDGEAAQSAPALIVNSPPTTPGVELSPLQGNSTTTFTCTVETPSTDADGDAVTYLVSWVINGYENPGSTSTAVTPSMLVSGATGPPAQLGDKMHCRVRASDGEAPSAPADSLPVVIGNSPPVGAFALVQAPNGPSAVEGDALTCAATGSDPDGQAVTWTYTWLVDGAIVDGQTDVTLSSEFFAKGDVVTCTATPSDGVLEGTQVVSKNGVLIANTLPSVAQASLTPEAGSRQAIFTCSYSGWQDADGDSEEVTYAWFASSEDGSSVEIPNATSATIQPTALGPGTQLGCRVTPLNGAEAGKPVESALALIVNTPPTLSGAVLGPATAFADTALVCVPEGFTDADGDDAVYAYAWKRANQDVEGATEPTLAGVFLKGDSVRCVITPSDGYEPGVAVLSNEVIVANKPPAVGQVVVDPPFGAACATYTCLAKDVLDPDVGDKVLLAYRWERNGVAITQKSKVLAGVALVPGDTLQCFVKPTDGALDADLAPIYGAEVSSNPAPIYNTPPKVADVAISPSTPLAGELLTCVPEGFEDPECDPAPAYAYKWYVDGEALPGAAEPTLATSGFGAGSEVTCQAIPTDGIAYGSPVLSAPVTLAAPPPDVPVVAVQLAPGGDLTCAITANPPPGGSAMKWYWQVNDAAEAQGAQVLSASKVASCDQVRCRMTAIVAGQSVASNTAAFSLPYGPACDDGDDCTAESCKPIGGCQSVPVAAANACDDGDHCTTGDSCAGGTCNGAPASCDDGNVCTTDSCDPTTGCTHAPLDGSGCDDGNACTSSDACAAGLCKPGPAKLCDDGNPCTVDGCAPATGCNTVPKSCNDGDACTDDACDPKSGCVAPPKTCSDGNLCTDDSCAPATGCAFKAKVCTDGDGCTDDACTAATGACAFTPKVCDDKSTCTADACDPVKGCVFVAKTCDDQDACTADTCQSGQCVFTAKVCTDSNPCTDDTCAKATGCVYTKDDTNPCSDTNVCTESEKCVNGSCASVLKTCDDGNACTMDTCAPATGCATIAKSCNDGDACTDDACDPKSGCVAPPKTCSDGTLCTDDSCVPATGCAFKAKVCSDGSSCTDDSCDPVTGGCAFTPKVCDDKSTCTADACDPAKGCVFTVKTCDDQDACTTDTCQSGQCLFTAKVCNDSNPCTDDACAKATGCVYTKDDTNLCTDGNVCTEAEKCVNGACTSTPKKCDDGNVCTTDACNTVTGCFTIPDNTKACEDGNACTTGDTCSSGGCVSGTPDNCDDGNPCTTDTCDSASGCKHTPNAAVCNDGNVCTNGDICSGGVCSPGPCACACCSDNVCDDGSALTTDTCVAGTCIHTSASCASFVSATLGDNVTGTGSSTSPWKTISFALSKTAAPPAGTTATICVLPGLYNSHMDAVWGEVFPMTLKNGVSIVGQSPSLVIVDAEKKALIFTGSKIGSATRVQGLTLSGGGYAGGNGGGLDLSSSNVEIVGNIFTACTTYYGGAAVRVSGGSPWIHGNVFSLNVSTSYGGIIDLSGSTSIVERNIFTDNKGGGTNFNGGDIAMNDSSVIRNNIFSGSKYHALAIGTSSVGVAAPLVSNNTFYNGKVYAIYLGFSSKPEIANNVFSGFGTAIYEYFWIAGYQGSVKKIDYNLFHAVTTLYHQATGANYVNSTVLNAQLDFTEGNIDGDPAFVNAAGGNFALGPKSPAIDTGHPEAVWNDPNGTRCDIGAYGGPYSGSIGP